jgi:hypothetical protein
MRALRRFRRRGNQTVTEKDPLLELERLIKDSLAIGKKAKKGYDGPR